MDNDYQKNVPLSALSTFGIGGPVSYLKTVSHPDELVKELEKAVQKSLSWKICASGSNIVFPDEGLDCVLIRYVGGRIEKENHIITTDAGVLLMDLISQANSWGFAGLETLAGIPGTVGGAIIGNAGAYGHSISEAIEEVEVYRDKDSSWLSNKDCQFSYRESIFKHSDYIVLRAKLRFTKGDPGALKQKSEEIVKIRESKYKPGLKCPGSFFKNVLVSQVSPETLSKIPSAKIIEGKIPAGYLLEQVGAKGMQAGGIRIADHHGNLFVNVDGGTAKDVKELSQILKQKVLEQFGIILEEEIRYF